MLLVYTCVGARVRRAVVWDQLNAAEKYFIRQDNLLNLVSFIDSYKLDDMSYGNL